MYAYIFKMQDLKLVYTNQINKTTTLDSEIMGYEVVDYATDLMVVGGMGNTTFYIDTNKPFKFKLNQTAQTIYLKNKNTNLIS